MAMPKDFTTIQVSRSVRREIDSRRKQKIEGAILKLSRDQVLRQALGLTKRGE